MPNVSAATYMTSYARPIAASPPHQVMKPGEATQPMPLPSTKATPMKPAPLPSARAISARDMLASLADASAKSAPSKGPLSIAPGNGSPREAAAPNNEPLTLEGLLKAWGQNIEEYDLNGDGTVDVLDLLMFLDQHM